MFHKLFIEILGTFLVIFFTFYITTIIVLYDKSYIFVSENKSKLQTVWKIWAYENDNFFFQIWDLGPKSLGIIKRAWLWAKLGDTVVGLSSRSGVHLWLYFHDLKNHTKCNIHKLFVWPTVLPLSLYERVNNTTIKSLLFTQSSHLCTHTHTYMQK